jgi:uncharacterized protein YndB with AHSA1/START domain
MSLPQHGSFTIERRFRAAPSRVFEAFADPAKKRLWFVGGEGFVIDEHTMDFRIGGSERSRFLINGAEAINDTWFADIVPNGRIAYAYVMTFGGRRVSASLATFDFHPDSGGTLLVFTEQSAFFDGTNHSEPRKRGWRSLLAALGRELGEA